MNAPEKLAKELSKIAEQEKKLVFPGFDEARAFSLGSRLREIGIADGLAIAIDVTVAGGLLFYAALPGASPDNTDWIRRKRNVTMRTQRASFAIGLEGISKGVSFNEKTGAPLVDFAPNGGSFPIRVASCALVIGAVTVSGLPQRSDHELVVRAIAEEIGIDPKPLAFE